MRAEVCATNLIYSCYGRFLSRETRFLRFSMPRSAHCEASIVHLRFLRCLDFAKVLLGIDQRERTDTAASEPGMFSKKSQISAFSGLSIAMEYQPSS